MDDKRSIWYLGPGGLPFAATRKKPPAGATHSAKEGDPRWTPLPGAGLRESWIGRDYTPPVPVDPRPDWAIEEVHLERS